MIPVLLVIAGYVMGSMPWGLWLVRLFRGEDIRTQGSGNIGATNVWRVRGRRLGLPAVFLDTAKGFVPAFVATKLESHGIGVLAGGAAMLGHYRPLFLRFRKGGKMVATAGRAAFCGGRVGGSDVSRGVCGGRRCPRGGADRRRHRRRCMARRVRSNALRVGRVGHVRALAPALGVADRLSMAGDCVRRCRRGWRAPVAPGESRTPIARRGAPVHAT